jgi:hypothetical protein
MNEQVQRLEELLARVERNRRIPRAAMGAGVAQRKVERSAENRSVKSRQQAARVSVPQKVQVAVSGIPAAPMSLSPAAEIGAVARPVAVVPAAVIRAVHAVAKVVSEFPKFEEPTFGQLLRRSLSLRPS